jgi:transcriptional regulator with XRE-family HTH domain
MTVVDDYLTRTGRKPQELANEMGVSRVTVTRWKSGRRKPGVEHVKKLARIIGVPSRDIRPDLAEVLE